jgi:hypothetical protein
VYHKNIRWYQTCELRAVLERSVILLEIFNTKYYFLHIILVYEKFSTSLHFKSEVKQSVFVSGILLHVHC